MTALPFAGLTVVVTGDVPGMDRDQANDAVRRLGGTPVGSVSARTGLIITGTAPGVSKMEKAKALQTPVAPADVLLALAADPASWDGQPVGEPLAVPPPPPPREPYVMPKHRIGSATGTYDKVWACKVWCTCGWRLLGPRLEVEKAAAEHSAAANAAEAAPSG